MKKILSLVFLISLFFNLVKAQDSEDILLTIDGRGITKEEFLRIYKKNNQNIQSGEKTDVEEYLDMFINFKLKVIEAENQGIDTIPSVKNEIEKYKHELAKPYLVDSQVYEKLVKEAYERSKKEVRASHILVKFPNKVSYKDTLFAYKKAKGIQNRIVLKKENFREVAMSTSDDPSVKRNGGDLGYFSAFRMVYPFEEAAYKMQTGDISNPVRTEFGYHIIKKTDERKAKGKIKVAHIMLLAPKTMSEEERKEKKEKINEIYHKLMGGADFSEMVKKYSDDKGSVQNGGELPWFGVGRMVPAFEEAAFSLDRIGEISKPVKTAIGWHIIKLLDRREIGSFEESRELIQRKIRNNPRYKIAVDSLIEDLKAKNNYKLDSTNFNKLQNTLLGKNNALFLNRTNKLLNDHSELFKYKDNSYQVADFINYLNNLPRDLKNNYEGKFLFDKAINQYTENKIVSYEKEQLTDKYSDYKYLVKEYKDGILLFEIMDRKIWSRATEDSTGLKNYYEKNKENYKWGERFKGKIYLCDTKETLKEVKKMKKGGLFRKKYSDEEVLNEFNTENKKKVRIKQGIFRKGENPVIDHYAWNKGSKEELKENKYYMVKGKVIPPSVKTLDETRGEVIADYQNYLEEEWLKELKEKYHVKVNSEVVEKLKSEFQ